MSRLAFLESSYRFLSSNTQDFIEVGNGNGVDDHARRFLSSNTQDFIEVVPIQCRPKSQPLIPEL